MLSTGVMAFLGFFFWMVATRLFTAEQVGVGTTAISAMSLLTAFSLLGFGNGLIKYLPTSKEKNEKINTSFTLVLITSLAFSAIFLIFLKKLSPTLLFLNSSRVFAATFVLFVIFSSLNAVVESVFIAYRASVYVLIKNIIYSICKLVLPFGLVSLGAYGIFVAFGVSGTVAFVIALWFLISRFNYTAQLSVNLRIAKRMSKFSLGNYAAEFIGKLPSMTLPLVITNTIGPSYSAFFYMDMMIISMLFIIPSAVAQSLFAEGSYNEEQLNTHLRKAINMIVLMLVPAAVLTIFFGSYILMVFGKQYSNEGIRLLQLLAVSSLFVAVTSVGEALLKIKHKIRELVALNVLYCA
jgi:O-antigen/teichoic acid export membrane protein